MTLALFLGWVACVFAASDLVGNALRRWWRGAVVPPDLEPALATGAARLAAAAHSTLLGFAALWVVLSAAYALGIATGGVIAAVIGASAVAAALAQRRQLAAWGRSRLAFWAVMGAVALLASCVRPSFNGTDDPEYLYLITKLLHTGSVIEYFNYHRPITLGGWTLVQAIFSAGPAGTAFVASIDAVVGGLFLLLCALLLEADAWTALAAASFGLLMVQRYQFNLGTAVGMAAVGALLVGLSVAEPVPAADFTAMTFAVMALTIRPQLGLIAIAAALIVCLRRRARWYLPAGVAIVLLSLWVVIFIRDTSLLPLSQSPSYNPATNALDLDLAGHDRSLLWQLAFLAQHHWKLVGVMGLAMGILAWRYLGSTRTAEQRRLDRVLAVFATAAVTTVIVMDVAIGSRAWEYTRYSLPIVEGVLYALFVKYSILPFRREHLARTVWLRNAVTAGAAAVALGASTTKLAAPAESSARICATLLTPNEQRAFDRLGADGGYTVLEMDCPVGSFTPSPRVMKGDLFFSTRGDAFEITWTPEDAATWLRHERIDRLVYLENDRGWNFGAGVVRRWVESQPQTSDMWAWWKYDLESLDLFRGLARTCPTTRMPIADVRGPLVIVDVERCAATVPRHLPGAEPSR